MEEKERNNKGRCKVTRDGLIACEVKLANGGRISQKYKASLKCLPIVEKDFMENKVKPRIIERLKEGNILEKTEGLMREKPVRCRRQFAFRNEGSLRIMEESGVCIEEEERWKKAVNEIKGWIR